MPDVAIFVLCSFHRYQPEERRQLENIFDYSYRRVHCVCPLIGHNRVAPMRFSRPSSRTAPLQALPSIITGFPISGGRSIQSAGTDSDDRKEVEDGIEVVPIERSDSMGGKIVSPGTEEKEVVLTTQLRPLLTKPLPCPPKTNWMNWIRIEWLRLSVKRRMLIIFSILVGMVLMIVIGFRSIKKKTMERYAPQKR